MATIKQNIILNASPSGVYEALSNPQKHGEFTGSKATGGDKVNAKFTAWDGYIYGKVLELVPGKRIVLEWKTTEWPSGAPASTVEFTLTKTENGTKLSMVHSSVPESQAEDLREGWTDYYWTPLKKYFNKSQQ